MEGLSMNGLYVPQVGKSSGVTELHKTLFSGKKLLIGDIPGPGVIGHIYISHMNHSEEGLVLVSRGVIIRCFWDGETYPSVEVPLNDFFGVGFGKERRLNSAVWQRDGSYSLHTCFPMPFKKRAVIELENLTDKDMHGFYWAIEYDEGIALPDNLEYFHAHYQQSHPVPKTGCHTVLEVEGHGKYVATIWSVNWMSNDCPPENAFSFVIDGQPVQGANSEDYFCQSWGFRNGEFQTPHAGQSLEKEKTVIGSTQMTSYRIHLPNPILFQKTLRFTMDCQAYNQGYRTDTYDTVAFWYQSHPHLPFPSLPPLEELLPIQYVKSWWRKIWEIHSAEKARSVGEALMIAGELVQKYPRNSKIPDVLFKMASLHEQLDNPVMAHTQYRQIIEKYPQSEAASDAGDKIWLLEKPGRLLLTLITPSGWTAYMDGQEISLPQHLFHGIPIWGEKVHYRYGRGQVLRCGMKEVTTGLAGLSPGDPIPVVSDPYCSAVYEPKDNIVCWNDSSSSIMRLFTLRLEPGPGKHLLAVEARNSNDVPIALESQSPGGMAGILDCNSKLEVTDGTWRVSGKTVEKWQDPATSDADWDYASVYPNESYGDAAWFWLYPRGFRKYPGYFSRIWGKERQGAKSVLYFRKQFFIDSK